MLLVADYVCFDIRGKDLHRWFVKPYNVREYESGETYSLLL